MLIPTEMQMQKLVDAIQPADEFAVRDQAMLILLANTGVCVSELVSLTVGTVYSHRVLCQDLVVVGKGRKRVIPLNQASPKALASILKFNFHHGFPVTPESPLFFNRYRVPMTARGVQLIVQKLRERAGIQTPHGFRHRFVSSLLQRASLVVTFSRRKTQLE